MFNLKESQQLSFMLYLFLPQKRFEFEKNAYQNR